MRKILLLLIGLILVLPIVTAAPKSEDIIGVTVVLDGKSDLQWNTQHMRTQDTGSDVAFVEDYDYHLINAKHIFIKESDLDKLKDNPNVKSVEVDVPLVIFLQNSVPLINADKTHALQVNANNLTGKGQSVCVIDTGVDYTHPDLGGCFGVNCKVIGGYDFVNNDADPMDDNGHGTHVAGIIAASQGIMGVAPDANIVAMKILDAGGGGVSSNLHRALKWCMGNGSLYNISVVSLSLGTIENYTNFCDADYPVTASWINLAVLQNISVIVASGNNYNYTAIAAPACIENATAVAATNSVGNAITDYSNRNSLVSLVAPGGSSSNQINSTKRGGSYEGRYGTSQAAPHVAAAILLLQQYMTMTSNRMFMPFEAKEQLNKTGIAVDDVANSGNIFRLIDVYAAINDLTNLTITIESPANVSYNYNNIDFNISVNKPLINAFAIVDGIINLALANDTQYHYYNGSLIGDGSHSVVFTANSTTGQTTSVTRNFVVDTSAPSIYLNSPTNNSFILRVENISLTVSDLSNVSVLYEYNNTNYTLHSPYFINTTNVLRGIFNITVFANDSFGFANSSIFVFNMSNTQPVLSNVAPSGGRIAGNVSVNATINDADGLDDIKFVTFSYSNDSANWTVMQTFAGTGSAIYNFTWNTFNVSDGQQYAIMANATDGINTTIAYSERNFTINNVNQAPSVAIISPTVGQTVSGTKIISWTANDVDLDTLSYAVYYSADGGASWTSLTTTSSLSYSWQTTSYANGANYIVKIVATDPVGLSSYNTSGVFTIQNTVVSRTTSGSTSSGGGMGGGSKKQITTKVAETKSDEKITAQAQPTVSDVVTSVTNIIESVAAGEEETISVSNSDVPVSEIKFKASSDINSASFNVEVLRQMPSEIATPVGITYKTMNMWFENVDENVVQDAMITFNVEKSWLQENGFDKNSVVLVRYNSGEWQNLVTNLKIEQDNSYTYEATTPGFSTFAIVAGQPEFLGTGHAVENIKNNENVIVSPLLIALFIVAAIFFLSAVYYTIKYTKK